jgi:hypothetical protein
MQAIPTMLVITACMFRGRSGLSKAEGGDMGARDAGNAGAPTGRA